MQCKPHHWGYTGLLSATIGPFSHAAFAAPFPLLLPAVVDVIIIISLSDGKKSAPL